MILYVLGNICSSLLALYLPDLGSNDRAYWWKFMNVFPIILVLIHSLCFIFIYNFETPKFYQLHKKLEDSQKTLSKIYKKEFVEEKSDIIAQDIKEQLKKKMSWKILFTTYRKPLLICLFIGFAQ